MFLIFTYRIITRNEHSIINVPFNKGEYSHDEYAFIDCFHFHEVIDYEFADSSSDLESSDSSSSF